MCLRCHHRYGCSTPFGITEVGIAPNPITRRRSTASAQRLSASQRWAFPAVASVNSLDPVLNAFRHHRGGHTTPDNIASGVREVLNAFRHHRGGHTRSWLGCHLGQLCSTPFGITEVGMNFRPRIPWARQGAQRLSASQRWASAFLRDSVDYSDRAQRLSASQRWALADTATSCCDDSECSTPFGITEVGIAATAAPGTAARGCSTPFGITEVGIRTARASVEIDFGAQRLSASQRWACAAPIAGLTTK